MYDTINLGWFIVYIEGSPVIISNKNLISYLKIVIVLANSVDTDEMQHGAAFHQGLHCLPKYPFRGFPVYKLLKHMFLNFRITVVAERVTVRLRDDEETR